MPARVEPVEARLAGMAGQPPDYDPVARHTATHTDAWGLAQVAVAHASWRHV